MNGGSLKILKIFQEILKFEDILGVG